MNDFNLNRRAVPLCVYYFASSLAATVIQTAMFVIEPDVSLLFFVSIIFRKVSKDPTCLVAETYHSGPFLFTDLEKRYRPRRSFFDVCP